MNRKPLRPMSAKRRKAQAERRRNMLAAFGENPRCQAMYFSPDCKGWADDAHEPRMRSRGADPTDPAQAIPVCRECHRRIHAEPALATRFGLLIPSWQDAEGEAFEGPDAA